MRLAIADPPYLGRAALWYGGMGSGKTTSTPGRAKGRERSAPEYHPDAHLWDDPAQHIALMLQMDKEYDGWAMAASGKTMAPLAAAGYELGARLAVWQVTNAIPDGARVRSTWEAVLIRIPYSRRSYGTGYSVPDTLSAPHPMSGFVGAKPEQWTRWVLDMLGYQPGDEVVDVFPGSGAVERASALLL